MVDTISDFPWYADGLTEDEDRAVRSWQNILRQAPAIAKTLLSYTWLADGVTEDESLTILHLGVILREAPATARTLLAFPWLADSLTRDESYAVYHFREILLKEPVAAETVLNSPWFSDGVTVTESQTLWGLQNLYDIDRGSLAALTKKPWFMDGLSYEEIKLASDLGIIAYRSENHFQAIMDMPFLVTLESADVLAVSSLRRLTYCQDDQSMFSLECSDKGSGYKRVSKKFLQAMSHPTISNGISDEEAKLVATLFGARLYNPDIFGPLLDPDTVTLEERTIDLPYTGETQLTIIRIRPGSERTMDLLERAVRDVEGFMGTPLPVRHVIYLSENTVAGGASNDWSNLTTRHVNDTDEVPEVQTLHVFAHETSHWYWYYEWGRHWVAEGLATFFQSMQRRQVEVGPDVPVVPLWLPHWPPCPYVANIAGLDEELDRLDDEAISESAYLSTLCYNSFGERLFQDLWRSLGEPVFRQGLVNLYLMSRSGTPVGECEFKNYDRAGICQVAAAFKSAASAGAAATVDKVIGRWYDSREPYDNSHVDTSPPNPNLPDGIKITRAYMSLDRDRPEKTRTDSFSASEIRERVYLHLYFSSPTAQPARRLFFTFVTYFEDGFAYTSEDGFAYTNNNATNTRNSGFSQNSLSFPIGAGPDYPWLLWDEVEREWAAGRHWVSVYHGEQKVAEVEFEVTP